MALGVLPAFIRRRRYPRAGLCEASYVSDESHALESLGYSSRPDVIKLIESALQRTESEWQASALTAIGRSADERWEDAERHFERALRTANEIPHVPEQADIRYWHAWMLLARHAAGDVERARVLLEEALPMFERAGRKRRKRESEELLRASHEGAVYEAGGS